MRFPRLVRSPLFGGLADQAIVSFGNFALSLVLAHRLSSHEYGTFSLALSFILFLNLLHQALVCYPLSVRGAAADSDRFRYLLSVAAIATPICTLVALPILGAALFSMKRLDLLPVAFLALVAWQLQEVTRRAILARARYRWAIAIDGLRYAGALGAILTIGIWVTPSVALLAIAGASALSVIVAACTLRFRFSGIVAKLPQEIAIHKELGGPVFLANLLLAFSTQWFLWLLGWMHGPAAAALLVAQVNIAAIVSPVMFGAENVLVPEIARTKEALSFTDLRALLWRRGGACLLLVAPILLALLMFPSDALHAFYGAASPYAAHPVNLQILTWTYAAFLVAAILGATLRGYGATEGVFRMQLYPAVFGVVCGTGLIWEYGVLGACIASLCAGLLRVIVGMQFVWKLRAITLHTTPSLAAAS